MDQTNDSIFRHSNMSLFNGDYMCELILIQLLVMYATTGLGRTLLFYATPRIHLLPLRRQQQLYTVPPVLLIKTIIVYLVGSNLIATQGRAVLPLEEQGNAVYRRYQTILPLCFSYVYELLERPSSPSIVGHHLILQALPFYFRFYLVSQPLKQVELVFGFVERMAFLGPGLSNIAADLVFLQYYLSPRTDLGRAMITAVCSLAHAVRAMQWAILSRYLWANAGSAAAELLNSWEKTIFSVSCLIWLWLQVEEILRLSGIARKFREAVRLKRA